MTLGVFDFADYGPKCEAIGPFIIETCEKETDEKDMFGYAILL